MKKRNVKKFKKLSQLKLKHRQAKVYAAADPEYIKTVEKLIERKVVPQKDTANYNSNVISYFIDKTVLALRDCGQKYLIPTDAFKIDTHLNTPQDKVADFKAFSLDNPLNIDYDYWAFNHLVDRELRTKFILKTEALDSFETLMDELDGLMPKYMSIEHWNKLKMAISKGNERVAKNKLVFIEPEVYLGKEMILSAKEMEKYQIQSQAPLKYDLRADGPDLIALKELLSMVKGEVVHPLSVGPGFFAKYTDEMRDADIYGLVFQLENKKLKQIHLYTPVSFEKPRIKQRFKEFDYRYAPVSASVILYSLFQKEMTMDELFKEKNSFYVVVPGQVSGPKYSLPFNYEQVSFNDTVTLTGDVFLATQLEGKPSLTRLYFVPNDYSNFHPYHQHGSVIFGNNDQSYHNCATTDVFEYPYQEYFQQENFMDNKLYYSGYYIYWALKMQNPKEKIESLMESPNHYKSFVKASSDIFEETKDSFSEVLKDALYKYDYGLDNQLHFSNIMNTFAKNYSPFHKRWHLRQYLQDGVGLVLKRNLGMIDKISEKAKGQEAFNFISTQLKNQKKS